MNLNDLHNLIDDLARPDGPSGSDLEAREAELQAAFDEHPEWMDELKSRDAFDVKLREVMPQVEVPEGLKDRLLAAADEQQSPAEPAPNADRERRSRRRAFALISAASLMFAASVWMVLNPREPSLTVAEVENELPRLWELMDSENAAPQPTDAVLPSVLNSGRLDFPREWQTHLLSGAEEQPLAFRKLEFVSTHGRSHTGLLAGLPLSRFSAANQPRSTSPFFSEIRYLRTSDGSVLAIVSWTDSQTGHAYFLAVPAGDRTLKALEELLYVQPV